MEESQGITGDGKGLPFGISPGRKENPSVDVVALCLSPRNGRKEPSGGKERGPRRRFSVLGQGKTDPRKKRSPPPYRRDKSRTNSPSSVRRAEDETKIKPLTKQSLRASLQNPGAMSVLSSFLRHHKEVESLFMLEFIAEVDSWGDEIPRQEALAIFESCLGCVDELQGRVSDRGFYTLAQASFAGKPTFSDEFAQAVADLKREIEDCDGEIPKKVFEPVIEYLLDYLGPCHFYDVALPNLRLWQGEFAKPFEQACEWDGSKLRKVEGQEAVAFNKILEKRITPDKVRNVVLSPRHGSFGARWINTRLERMESSVVCRPPGWATTKKEENWREQKAAQLVRMVLRGLHPIREALEKIEARRTLICELQCDSEKTTEWAQIVDRELGHLYRLLITGRLFDKEGKLLRESMDQRVTADILKGIPEEFDLMAFMGQARGVVARVETKVAELLSRSNEICKQARWVGDAIDKAEFFAAIKKDRTRQFQHEGKVTCKGEVRVNGELLDKKKGPKGYMEALAQLVCKQWPQPYKFDDQSEGFDEAWLPPLHLELFTGTSAAAEQIPYLKLKELCPELNDPQEGLKMRRVGEVPGSHDFIVDPENKRFAALKTLWMAVERGESDSTRTTEVLRFQLQAGLWFEEEDGHLCLKETSLDVQDVKFGAPVDWKLYDPLLTALERLQPVKLNLSKENQ